MGISEYRHGPCHETWTDHLISDSSTRIAPSGHPHSQSAESTAADSPADLSGKFAHGIGVGSSDQLELSAIAAQYRADPQFRRFFDKLNRRVPLNQSATMVAGLQIPWFLVSNPEALLEAAVSRTDRPAAELDPFWSSQWRAASGLDRFLQKFDLQGVPILELGCGSGRAGIAAAMRGARVTLTDAVGEALMITRLNAWLVKDSVRIRRLRWTQDQLPERYPIILGSDIVYDVSLWPLLEPCMRSHLLPGGVVLLSEPQRHTGDKFDRWIVQQGWKQESTLIDLGDNNREIRIFQCSLPTAASTI